MAKTKRKRTRKHRGTQGGSISRRPAGRPRTRAEAKSRAQKRRTEPRGPKPPTWPGALGKGVLASGLFFALFVLVFSRPLGSSLAIAAFTMVFYVPLSYAMDSFMYRRAIEKERKAHEERKAK